ncbi:hypothetical protein O9992_13155 [Vibrio lentus]|nr:hypothetical protein [Vibrio lentus]
MAVQTESIICGIRGSGRKSTIIKRSAAAAIAGVVSWCAWCSNAAYREINEVQRQKLSWITVTLVPGSTLLQAPLRANNSKSITLYFNSIEFWAGKNPPQAHLISSTVKSIP